tara:strand:+ start:2965 stop:3729 length:765 start_codon:yes stop_codon:yes gene_type:complete
MIDTHCHINDEKFKDDIDDIISRSVDSGITKIICVGTDLKTSERALNLSSTYDIVYASVGYHPHESKDAENGYIYKLEEMTNNDKVVAIGETGLDYYYNVSPKNIQKKIFMEQIELAKNIDLPVVMHNRKSSTDLIKILDKMKLNHGVVHCFSEDWNIATRLLEMKIKLSFTGIITFIKNPFCEVLKNISLDDFFIETDSPYLAPIPLRGKRNEPSNIKHIAQYIADLRKIPVEEIIENTSNNALKFFKKINSD